MQAPKKKKSDCRTCPVSRHKVVCLCLQWNCCVAEETNNRPSNLVGNTDSQMNTHVCIRQFQNVNSDKKSRQELGSCIRIASWTAHPISFVPRQRRGRP